MRRILLDPAGGIAGDMFVAAMLDAVPDLRTRVLADGAAVLPPGIGSARLEEGESGALRVLRFGLACGPVPAPAGGRDHHDHADAAGGQHTGHGHHDHAGPDHYDGHGDHEGGRRSGHGHHHDHGAHHHGPEPSRSGGAHRHNGSSSGTFCDMVARIESASLHSGTNRHAVAILTILARAEAAIHGVPVDEVHFHEIADWDSLLDVVCAGSIAAALEGAVWAVSPLPRGGGLVRTQHGLLPVPAPATAAILAGFEWRDDGVAGERVTPTGAAILKHLAQPVAAGWRGRLMSSGTGAGTRHLPGIPNVLRALLFEDADEAGADTVAVLEFEIDDMTGEEIGVAAERLRAEDGVLDLSISQRLGKKSRPLASVRLLARPERAEAVARCCFAQTSTIGLRLREDRRLVLPRESASAAGIPVKAVARPGGRTVKAESDALSGETLAERRALKRQAEDGND